MKVKAHWTPYRLTANKTKLYALAKSLYPCIEPMKIRTLSNIPASGTTLSIFGAVNTSTIFFLSVCGGQARLADWWSTYDENDERTEHWECRVLELDELREFGLVEEVTV